MLISRGIPVLRTVCNVSARQKVAINLEQVRQLKLLYRGKDYPERIDSWAGEVCQGIAYWWVFWFAYHEMDVLRKGHIPGPVPDIFSDDELGIPPDDAD